MNVEMSLRYLQELSELGVTEYCVCAGARNAPLVLLLAKARGLKVYSFFEERSAGFFALGRSARSRLPVAIVTTSGTAVAELLPAAIEATYQSIPLLFLTADRPRNYRGTGAPQSIEQVGIFSHYVQKSWDVQGTDEVKPSLNEWTRQGPAHLNLCFSEPLLDHYDFANLPEFSNGDSSPKYAASGNSINSVPDQTLYSCVAIVAGLAHESRAPVVQSLKSLQIPIYAESLSGLKSETCLQSQLLKGGERSLTNLLRSGHVQSVLRIGSVPTLRAWRDLEDKYKMFPVIVASEQPWTGLARPVLGVVGLNQIKDLKINNWTEQKLREAKNLDYSVQLKVQSLYEKFPASEPALVSRLSQRVGEQNLYIGNSLPIREWDLVPPAHKGPQHLFANRGANGIDGQISTFLGWARGGESNWCVIGDLTALYDLAALWADRYLESAKYRIVIINNQGGQIFKNMFHHPAFMNEHNLSFSAWASMWGWAYQEVAEIPSAQASLPDRVILELKPNSEQTSCFWRELNNP